MVGNTEVMAKVLINGVTAKVGTDPNMNGFATNQDLASQNVPTSLLTRYNFRFARHWQSKGEGSSPGNSNTVIFGLISFSQDFFRATVPCTGQQKTKQVMFGLPQPPDNFQNPSTFVT